MPAYGAHRTLPYVLAGLAAQTYPSHLVEVIVVDDGAHAGQQPLELPEVRPDNARIVQVEEGWGRANACHLGAGLADGDVIHWLDADMLPGREHVEAQLRWHHEIDYAVVLGNKWFVDPAPLDGVSPAEVREAVLADQMDGVLPRPTCSSGTSGWSATTRATTTCAPSARAPAASTSARPRRWRATSTSTPAAWTPPSSSARTSPSATGSARRARCSCPTARPAPGTSGRTHVMNRRAEVNDYNDCFLSDRLPELRNKRRAGRLYAVPYLEVVLDTTGLPLRLGRRHRRLGARAARCPTCTVTLIGPWSELDDTRIHPLDDPMLDTRLVQASYAGDPRVRLVESLPEGRCPAMFRMTLENAEWAPTHKTVARLVHHLERTHHGLADRPDARRLAPPASSAPPPCRGPTT